MSQATGSITGTKSALTGSFTDKDSGKVGIFSIASNGSTEFTVSAATMVYTPGPPVQRSYSCTIGSTSFAFTVDNGDTISGDLDRPITTKIPHIGTISWPIF
ncbi:hypothetical protein PHLCEN_2v8452 [Hermanssonia centrifuga]|uniref:Uncharacterized protein n=1 Tax=Hermanssonia centrifuga TaxID=98765 RepID=A0A2R6NTL0_9APHY|nr:hypothetical protein PHLCEN_2v8452 [Hermanssonia centrifuga]